MHTKVVPPVFQQLMSNEDISENETVHTQDGFWMISKSLADRSIKLRDVLFATMKKFIFKMQTN